jgi:hypothetical protein
MKRSDARLADSRPKSTRAPTAKGDRSPLRRGRHPRQCLERRVPRALLAPARERTNTEFQLQYLDGMSRPRRPVRRPRRMRLTVRRLSEIGGTTFAPISRESKYAILRPSDRPTPRPPLHQKGSLESCNYEKNRQHRLVLCLLAGLLLRCHESHKNHLAAALRFTGGSSVCPREFER